MNEHRAPDRPVRKVRTNLALPEDVVADAKALGINMSAVAAGSIAAEVRAEKERRWKEENAEATAYWNKRYERDGHPLQNLIDDARRDLKSST